jgi:hypothetical protein
MSNVRQLSFAGGEISPSLYGRVDIVKYSTGLKTCRNFIVQRYGGVANRPGTGFVSEIKDSTKTIKYIPFVFNPSQTYVLEFGDQYMRVIKDGALLTEAAKTITGATQANPVVITSASHGFLDGEEVAIASVGGMTDLNGRNFKVNNKTASTFELQTMNGVDLDGTGFGAYTSGGTASRVYEISTPYVEADLQELQYVQSADIVTIVHPNYEPRELARSGDIVWTLTEIAFGPEIDRPTGLSVATGAAGSKTLKYQVTAIDAETSEESLVAIQATKTITGATQADPVVITTSAAHNYNTGDKVFIDSVVGMTEINGRVFTITDTGATTFELDDEDGTGHTAYSSGGTSARTHGEATSAGDGTDASPHVITWTAVTGAGFYNVYRELNGTYGWIGLAGETTFNDTGFSEDTLDSPPVDRQPFETDFPSAVTFYQQRLIFANTDNAPEKVWTSKSGLRKNFMVSTPLQDDDAVTFELVGRQVNEVKHLLDIGTLVMFTTSAEWSIGGDASGVLTPTAINPQQQTQNGSGDLAPLVVSGSALYVQARGSVIRDLEFDANVTEGYRGNELTIFASHLFDGETLVDWTYQQIPHSIVWVVRDDGTLLGLTYVKEHEVAGWHKHDFEGGTVENVVVVPEGTEDSLYLLIKRTVDGRTVRYTERLKTRQITDIVDSVFLDSSLSLDGTHTGSTTMTLSGGSTWAYDEDLTLTASAAFFTSTDVGNEIHLTGSDGTLLRCEITAFTSTTIVTVRANKTVPTAMRTTAIATWGKAVDEISGLWHLEGKEVSVFADGFVVANPNNDAYDVLTVTDGSITLARPYVVIHVGLPITSDMETLNIDLPGVSSMSDKKKNINRLTAFVESTRGLFAGPDADNLLEFKLRDDEGYDDPPDLQTGTIDINMRSEWNTSGQIFIRQIDPIPASILTILPTGYIGGP